MTKVLPTSIAKIPVTLLTGFLGAGKTTLLQRILTERHGEKIAVIENEFGETSVDAELLFKDSSEQIIELNNGCICCRVRGDLVRILSDLHQRRTDGTLAFDRVVIETTGLADPAPVAQTFFVEQDVKDHYFLDAIVTLVDAVHAQAQLDEHHEAIEQVAFADRLLVTKSDLVTSEHSDRLIARLRQINARARIARADFGLTNYSELLDVRGFSLNDILEIEPEFLTNLEHEHDDDITSFVFSSSRPFRHDLLAIFFQWVVDQHGSDLMRYKGVLHYEDFERRVVLQGVHMVMNSDVGSPWGDAPRASSLVFIGRNLPVENMKDRLTACLV